MANEAGRAADLVGISASESFREGATHRTTFLIRKWEQEHTDWVANRIDPDLVPLVRSGQKTLQLRHFQEHKVAPYEEILYEGNVITTAGWGAWMAVNTGAVGAALFGASKGRLGVGSGTGTWTAGDTALNATAGLTTGHGPNWILFGAAPTLTGGSPYVITFPAVSFGSGISDGTWNEFAIDSGTANSSSTLTTVATGVMFNHGGGTSGAYGTKGATSTWNATVTLTFT